MKIPLYLQDGSKKGEMEVSEKVFGIKPNQDLIHKALVIQLGNARHPIAHTLLKGEVRGGGKKPYRQKGTGRARQGSSRNPQFRGGGVAFGPRNTRNFTKRLPRQERRMALAGVLSEKFKEGHISALESFTTDAPKTKFFAEMISVLPFKKKILFVLPEKNETVTRCARNLQKVKISHVGYVNVSDLLKYEDIVFFKDAVSKLEKNYE